MQREAPSEGHGRRPLCRQGRAGGPAGRKETGMARLVAPLALVLALGACNTIDGIGMDISGAARSVAQAF